MNKKLKTIDKILIANRGEIALRIMRTCRKLGIKTVAVFSRLDAGSPHVKFADESFLLDGEKVEETYLNIEKIILAAKICGASAIHPGYGFLAENADFAAASTASNIKFLGPTSQTLALLGHKGEARKLAFELNIPTIRGYNGEKQDASSFTKEAKSIGLPLLVKAALGGGGKGLRRVDEWDDLEPALKTCAREGLAFFGSSELILEQFIDKARHIEVQIVGDQLGNVIHLFERDCTLQRRNQKIIEEAPAPKLTEELRKSLYEAAISIGKKLKLESVATVEFLVSHSQDFYFLEVNPRIQVEHPVTELITGLDIVQIQIAIARGEKINNLVKNLKIYGAAIEARINAEIPECGFIPSDGRIEKLYFEPENTTLRLEHALCEGLELTARFDPLLAKIISWGETREDARRNLIKAIENFAILGVGTNADFLRRLLSSELFKEANFSTRSVEISINNETTAKDFIAQGEEIEGLAIDALCIAFIFSIIRRANSSKCFLTAPLKPHYNFGFKFAPTYHFKIIADALKDPLDAKLKITDWQDNLISFAINNGNFICCDATLNEDFFSLSINARKLTARISASSRQIIDNNPYYLSIENQNFKILAEETSFDDKAHSNEAVLQILSPLPGKVLSIINVGEEIIKGTTIAVIESMKMEHQLIAPTNAKVLDVKFLTGDSVKKGDCLLKLENLVV